MGMTLPSELVSLLNILGYNWPQADETKLFDLGQELMNFSNTLQNVLGSADGAASRAWSENSGQDIQAFMSHWTNNDGPAKILGDGSTASTVLGAGMMICAGIVLALKIQVISQLVILAIQIAQAIAMAVVTFGASLLEIPIFQQISRAIVGQLIDMVITKLLEA
jgi:hypothetical protein